MNFIHNRIINPSGDGPTFDEWVSKVLKEAAAENKTASEAAPGKGLDDDKDPRNSDKSQVINTEGEPEVTNNPEMPEKEQKESGQSSEVKETSNNTEEKANDEKQSESQKEVKEASCGKEMGECDNAGKVTEQHSEASPGDDENPEPKVLINNDPNYQKGESVDGKKAKASLTARFAKIADLDRLHKLALLAALSSHKDYPIEYVEAMVGIKVANLTEEEKQWFSDYWKTLYPPEYVEKMIEDR